MKKLFFLCLCLVFIFCGSANGSFGRPNVALEGNIISSTPAVSGSASAINDGLLSTLIYSHTLSEGRYYCEFVLDLGRVCSIDKIDIYISQTRGFSIYISDSNGNWNNVKTYEWAASVGTAVSIPFDSPISGRYLKYYGWASWNQYVGVSEMAVYEQGSVPPSSPPGSSGTSNIAAGIQIIQDDYSSEPDNPPSKAFDGDTATSWIPAYSAVDHESGKKTYYGGIVIDLGREIDVGKVIFKTGAYHSVVISFPGNAADFWGEKWLFRSLPDFFVTENAGSGELVFEINGLIKSRYMTVYAQTFQVTDLKPAISEVEVYEWTDTLCPDSDGDGVPDQSDQCPDTPAGSPVYSNGCPSIKGDFNNNRKLDLGDCIGILQTLTGTDGQ